MGNEQNHDLASAIGAAVAAALGPVLERIEAQLADVDARVSAFVPRRTITDSVKVRHRDVLRELGGRCPCCGTTPVVDDAGAVLQGAEWDHYYSRERRDFGEVWLICRPCHRGMRDRHEPTAEFQAFQRRAAAIDGGQLRLLP